MVVPSGNFGGSAGHVDLLVEGKRQDVRRIKIREHLLQGDAHRCLNGTVKISHLASLSTSYTHSIALRCQFVARNRLDLPGEVAQDSGTATTHCQIAVSNDGYLRLGKRVRMNTAQIGGAVQVLTG